MEPSFRSHQVILNDRHYIRTTRCGGVTWSSSARMTPCCIKAHLRPGGRSFWTMFNADDGELVPGLVSPAKLRGCGADAALPSYRLTG